MLIVLSIAVCILVTNADAQCYDGWMKFGSSCYGFGEEYVSWAGASALCRMFDGTLAEIETAEENNFLKEHAKNRSYRALWVGGTDIFSEGHWIWSGSKQPVQGFTDWGPGEPNHAAGQSSQDCMNLLGLWHDQWNDDACKDNNPFVCEVKLEYDPDEIVG